MQMQLLCHDPVGNIQHFHANTELLGNFGRLLLGLFLDIFWGKPRRIKGFRGLWVVNLVRDRRCWRSIRSVVLWSNAHRLTPTCRRIFVQVLGPPKDIADIFSGFTSGLEFKELCIRPIRDGFTPAGHGRIVRFLWPIELLADCRIRPFGKLQLQEPTITLVIDDGEFFFFGILKLDVVKVLEEPSWVAFRWCRRAELLD